MDPGEFILRRCEDQDGKLHSFQGKRLKDIQAGDAVRQTHIEQEDIIALSRREGLEKAPSRAINRHLMSLQLQHGDQHVSDSWLIFDNADMHRSLLPFQQVISPTRYPQCQSSPHTNPSSQTAPPLVLAAAFLDYQDRSVR